MRHVFLSILFFLFIPSCKQKLPDYSLEDVPIVIDIDSAKLLPLKVSRIQYLPLETSQEYLIGNADKVLIRNNHIYVADFGKAMALFVFDMRGKFLFKIARTGKGPGEYISFDDFDIQTNGDIYMYDSYGDKILIFGSNGEYLQDIRIDYILSDFCLAGGKMYWSKLRESGKMFANLAVYDMVDGRTEFLLKDKKFLHHVSLLNFSTYDFYSSPDHIYYSPKFSEIIYSIDENGIQPAIGIKNLLKPPAQVIEEWSQEKDIRKNMESIIRAKYFIENVYIYETNDYISIGCMRGMNRNTLLYNKFSKSSHTISASDCFMMIGVDGIKGSTGKDFFNVINFDSENEYHGQILEMREELADWEDEDNPVMVFFDLDM